MRPLVLLTLLLLLAPASAAKDRFFLKDGDRVLFLGDSNTQAGTYIQYLDTYLVTRFPERRFELINLGLASETVTGLSEPDHPFPRPDVHDRLERALALAKPTVVVACYGMNDGIYYPFSEERLASYQRATLKLVERSRAAGARVMLMTPPPFEPEPVRAKLLPEGAPKYSWMAPYERYDEVLGRYSQWLLTLRREGIPVVDLHGAINEYAAAVRKTNAAFRLTGDGIHPGATGHWLVAREVLRAWNAPPELERISVDAKRSAALEWTARVPLPADPQWDARLSASGAGADEWNRRILKVKGLRAGRHALLEGDTKLGELTAEELDRGVDLQRFGSLSVNRRAAEVLALVRERHRLLDPAWLSAVGHKRPGVAGGLPLPQAQAKAAALETRIRELSRPVKVTLRVQPL
jgi:lysophospholipase L1-like esterase